MATEPSPQPLVNTWTKDVGRLEYRHFPSFWRQKVCMAYALSVLCPVVSSLRKSGKRSLENETPVSSLNPGTPVEHHRSPRQVCVMWGVRPGTIGLTGVSLQNWLG